MFGRRRAKTADLLVVTLFHVIIANPRMLVAIGVDAVVVGQLPGKLIVERRKLLRGVGGRRQRSLAADKDAAR